MANNQNKVNMLSLDEFFRSGLLQEVNRIFFHPLGLALTVNIKDDSVVAIGGIQDFRSDEEGLVFSSLDRNSYLKMLNVQKEMERRKLIREERLGFFIQPVPTFEEPTTPEPEPSILEVSG